MEVCVKDYTVIYSQPSIEALENLVNEFFNLFGIVNTIDDLFYYGVFCKPQNYANFYDADCDYDFEIPDIILSDCESESSKIDYVEGVMESIMKKEIEKPEWMKYVELNMDCNEYGQAPSTFLNIIPKTKRYTKLAQRLIEFLYSPNMVISMVEN